MLVAHLINDRVLLHHGPALHTEPVPRGGIVLYHRPSTIGTHSLHSVRAFFWHTEGMLPTISVLGVHRQIDRDKSGDGHRTAERAEANLPPLAEALMTRIRWYLIVGTVR